MYPLDPSTGLFEFALPGTSGIFGKSESRIQLKAETESEMRDWLTEMETYCKKKTEAKTEALTSPTRSNKSPKPINGIVQYNHDDDDDYDDGNAGNGFEASARVDFKDRGEGDDADHQTITSVRGIYAKSVNTVHSGASQPVASHGSIPQDEFGDFGDGGNNDNDNGSFADFESVPPSSAEPPTKTSPSTDLHNPWK